MKTTSLGKAGEGATHGGCWAPESCPAARGAGAGHRGTNTASAHASPPCPALRTDPRSSLSSPSVPSQAGNPVCPTQSCPPCTPRGRCRPPRSPPKGASRTTARDKAEPGSRRCCLCPSPRSGGARPQRPRDRHRCGADAAARGRVSAWEGPGEGEARGTPSDHTGCLQLAPEP